MCCNCYDFNQLILYLYIKLHKLVAALTYYHFYVCHITELINDICSNIFIVTESKDTLVAAKTLVVKLFATSCKYRGLIHS